MADFPYDVWPLASRETMLSAVEQVCRDIPGVKSVERQDVFQDPGAGEFPRIVVLSPDFSYSWRSEDRNILVATSVVELHLLASAPRARANTRGGTFLRSTVREAFSAMVVGTFMKNRTLRVQLDGEDSAQVHCTDFAPTPPQVRHLELDSSRIHTRVRFTGVETCDQFDGRTLKNFAELILELYPYGGDGVVADQTFDLS